MPGLTRDLGIDLGTVNTVITEGNQILLQEPTVVALLVQEQKMVEWGQSARDMLGRVSENIEVVRPLRHGVIAEFEITENLLQYLIKKTCGPMLLFRPRIVITVPYGITSVETRAVHEAGLGSGSRDVMLIKQPLAAALADRGLTVVPDGHLLLVAVHDQSTYDVVRDTVVDLDLPLVRIEPRRHRLEDLFRDEEPAA